jgi:hypothetical protein
MHEKWRTEIDETTRMDEQSQKYKMEDMALQTDVDETLQTKSHVKHRHLEILQISEWMMGLSFRGVMKADTEFMAVDTVTEETTEAHIEEKPDMMNIAEMIGLQIMGMVQAAEVTVVAITTAECTATI